MEAFVRDLKQSLRMFAQSPAFTLAAVAAGLARLITSFLFGVTAQDPLVFVGVPLLLAAVAFFAVWLPARRASSVDPLTALRYE